MKKTKVIQEKKQKKGCPYNVYAAVPDTEALNTLWTSFLTADFTGCYLLFEKYFS